MDERNTAVPGMGGAGHEAAEPTASACTAGWVSIAAVVGTGPGGIERRLDRLAERHGSRAVAGAYFASWLVRPVICALVVPPLTGGSVPDVSPTSPLLGEHPDGWFDAILLPTGCLDTDGGASGARLLAAADGLLRACQLLEPAVAALRSAARRAPRATWGSTVDVVTRLVMEVARAEQAAPSVAFDRLDAVLSGCEPLLGVRGRRLELALADGRPAPAVMKSVCCLAYRDRLRDGALCGACPRRSDDDAATRVAARLNGERPLTLGEARSPHALAAIFGLSVGVTPSPARAGRPPSRTVERVASSG